MADIPRLNGVIRALEQGKHAFTAFTPADPEAALALSTAKYDGIIFEMEHNPYDIRALRDSLQYMLNRRQIAQSGSLAPAVTPMVRILAGQASVRHRRLRDRVAAHFLGRGGLQCGGGLPLSEAEIGAAL
jgi:hypothetical protein